MPGFFIFIRLKRNKNIYSLSLRLISFSLQALLLWFTISLSLVADAQQKITAAANEKIVSVIPETEDESQVPGTSEDKALSGINLAEEFLHHYTDIQQGIAFAANKHLHYNVCLFALYHIELLSPPPEC